MFPEFKKCTLFDDVRTTTTDNTSSRSPAGSAPSLPDDDLIRACRDAGFTEEQWAAMTYETGAYDVCVPTVELRKLAEILRC